MSKIWLNIIGIKEGEERLSSKKLALIRQAKNIIGAKRLLEKLSLTKKQKIIEWNKPFAQMIEQIIKFRKEPTIILASGDPNWFGIGASLERFLPREEFAIHIAPSSFQLAASKLHWPMQNIDFISLHGRRIENLHKYLLPQNKILALTSDKNTLLDVALLLEQRGFENSNLFILENLGAKSENIISLKAHQAKKQKIGNFYVLGIECVSHEQAPLLPTLAGLDDSNFICDGQLTKREVRAVTIAKLAPFPNAILWDIGAGCGSIAIEFMRAARGAKAICFERNKKRIKMIEQNAKNLGTPNIEIIRGDALDNLHKFSPPDAIFIGGDVANNNLFEKSFMALKNGGRMVVNAVTIEGKKALFERYKNLGGELIEINIARAKQIGASDIFEPKITITQWFIIKGENNEG